MSDIRFFVTQLGVAVIECPHCDASKAVDVGKYMGTKHTMRVKCPCGHIFPIHLNFRKHHRKQTLFEGNYQKTDLNLDSYYEIVTPRTLNFNNTAGVRDSNCTVKDLSLGGVGLDIWGNHAVQQGDNMVVEFILDNKKRTFIRRFATVKTVRGNIVGAEFTDKPESYPDLGFYLMP